MIDLCAGRVTNGEKLGYVVWDRIRVKLLVSSSYPTVMYGYQAGTVFFFRYGSAKRKQHPLQSGDVLSGYRGLVAGWLGTAGTRQKY